jgi:hypothetical protein
MLVTTRDARLVNEAIAIRSPDSWEELERAARPRTICKRQPSNQEIPPQRIEPILSPILGGPSSRAQHLDASARRSPGRSSNRRTSSSGLRSGERVLDLGPDPRYRRGHCRVLSASAWSSCRGPARATPHLMTQGLALPREHRGLTAISYVFGAT